MDAYPEPAIFRELPFIMKILSPLKTSLLSFTLCFTAMAADRTRVRNWLGAFVTTHAHVNVGGDGDEDFDDDGTA